MKNKKIYIITGIIGCMLQSISLAVAEDESIIVQGISCEPIKADESKSTVRVRATDSASFKAVSAMSALSRYQSEMDGHDFNVLVYQIVDNYIEDMTAKTTEQTDEKVCVSVTGYVSSTNLATAVDEFFAKKSQPVAAEENQNTSEQTNAMSDAITKELAQAEQNLQEQEQQSLKQKEIVFAGDEPQTAVLEPELPKAMEKDMETALTTPTYQAATAAPQAKTEPKTTPQESVLVYVEPLIFYDNSTSEAYADIIKDFIKQDSHILLTDNKNLAEYILTPKVLRAKVDAVNTDTNRLQMVVSLNMYDVSKDKNTTEHRNRFIIYKTSADEQQTAYELMQSLFEDSSRQLLAIIKNGAQKKENENWGRDILPSIITPATEYLPKADAETPAEH